MQRRRFLAAAGVGCAAALGGCDPAVRETIEGGFTGIDVGRGHAWRDGALRAGTSAPAQRTRIVIAGGGIAGLAAARALRLRGIEDFVLLELEDSTGGNSRGSAVAGVPCPLGAHYLPVPGDDAHEVQDLLEEFGLRHRVAGRWQYDERSLCHSPQERLFHHGEWQEGLLPLEGATAATLAQYRRFARHVDALGREARFCIPAFRAPPSAVLQALRAQTFAAWLAREGLDDPMLRWYLEYCCRDDYGAGPAQVSAWAGVHYFASRHGFHLPGEETADREGVLTWPEGNAWLARRLAQPLGGRARTGCVVTRIADGRHGVEVEAFDVARRAPQRWLAERCIVALPVFVAARVVDNPPAVLRARAARAVSAPWLVANVHVRAPLADRPGPAPSWDNVVFGTRGLGYVDAGHQRLDPTPAATVLSWYRPLGPSSFDDGDGRRRLLERPWRAWRDELLDELSVPHPDLPSLATRIDITRYGHAMAMPAAWPEPEVPTGGRVRAGRLDFAHADWSGYSIFEEAFTRGHLAAGA